MTLNISSQLPHLQELYRDFHAHPELSGEEEKTAQKIEAELRSLGLESRRVGGTGVVAVLKNGEGPCILARADTDALPVSEDTGLPYISETEGIMHACGHDTHITALLGALAYLHQHRQDWAGTYVAVFQPAEEDGAGAARMLADGLQDYLASQGVKKLDLALAQHVVAGQAGEIQLAAGVALSAAHYQEITVFGRGGHGSMPHTTVDPVLLAASIVVRLQGIVAREIDPAEFAVVTVGQIHAGTRVNIIGDRASLGVSIRAHKPEILARCVAAVERIVRAECAAAGAEREPEFEVIGRFPVTLNDDAARQRLSAAFEQEFGRVKQVGFLNASEDFSLLPAAYGAPYLYWFVGGTPSHLRDNPPTNHSPFFAPPLEVLEPMTRAQIAAALEYLQVP